MQNTVYKILEPMQINGEVIIGFFDVIHKGHMLLLENNQNASIITFYDIPRKSAINDWQTRVNNLAALGFKNIYLVRQEELKLTAKVFLNKYLSGASKIIVGEDFILGSDFQPIVNFSDQFKLELKKYDRHYSTSLIKDAMAKGDFVVIQNIIGSPFIISKEVMRGNQMGHKLGFPTINFNLANDHVICPGIYYSNTVINDVTYKSVTVMISNKQLPEVTCDVLETHILDFNGDLYGQTISVMMFKKLGVMKKFDDLEALKNSIQFYVNIVKNI